jgi:hypothetical protein
VNNFVLILALVGAFTMPARADDENAKNAELAKKLNNPIANLISVPIQNNWDFGIGPADAMQYKVNIQPVIPFSISKDWNVISRTILPVIYAESPVPGGEDEYGLGDTTQSFFFSPSVSRPQQGILWNLFLNARHFRQRMDAGRQKNTLKM